MSEAKYHKLHIAQVSLHPLTWIKYTHQIVQVRRPTRWSQQMQWHSASQEYQGMLPIQLLCGRRKFQSSRLFHRSGALASHLHTTCTKVSISSTYNISVCFSESAKMLGNIDRVRCKARPVLKWGPGSHTSKLHIPLLALTKKKPSGVIGLYKRSTIGQECPWHTREICAFLFSIAESNNKTLQKALATDSLVLMQKLGVSKCAK